MGDKRAVRAVAVVLLVATLIGVVPQSHARAWAPPVPVAPPVTGLCTTPVGAILCIAGAGALVVGSLWASDRIAGWTPQEDGTWDWCEYDGVLAAIECLDGGNPPPIPSGDWTDLLPEVTSFQAISMTEVRYLAPDPVDNAALLDAYGIWITGGVVAPLADGRSGIRLEIAMQRTASAAEWCPEVEVALGSNALSPAEWAAAFPCIAMTGRMATQRYGGSVTEGSAITCSGGTAVQQEWQGGGRVVAEAWCDGGEMTGLNGGNFWKGPQYHNPSANLHTELYSCNLQMNRWSWSTFDRPVSTCTGLEGETHPLKSVRMRSGDPAEIMTVAVTDCRAPDGTVTTRISNGEAVPSFETDVPPAPSGCLAGELPMRTTLSVCEAGDLTSCNEIADIAIPTIPDEIDLDCLYRLASDNPCAMWLEHWNGQEWEECVPDDNCVGWWWQTNRETHYRCGWGGNYFSASQCVPLRDFYDSPDGDVTTNNPTQPAPDPIGAGDPVQIGGPVPPPTSQPTRTWYGRIIYEWWGGGPQPMMQSCWPQGWGLLNPLQWVLRPTMCALAWAFVPQTPLEVRLETMMEALKAKTGLDLEAVATFPLPSVGSACGWGFAAWEGNYVGEVPAVNIIPCPDDLGPAGVSAAATSRFMSYGILGMWTFGLLHRWFSLRNDPLIAAGDEGGSVV